MEFWDLYDENKLPTGKTIQKGEKVKKGFYRIVVHICIFNNNNEILIQRRKDTKKVFPSLWDLSVGGSVITKETSRQAAERELREELGVKHLLKEDRPLFSYSFENGFDDFYFIKTDLPLTSLKLQDSEVERVKWASKEKVFELLEKGEFVPYFKFILENLFATAENLEKVKTNLFNIEESNNG